MAVTEPRLVGIWGSSGYLGTRTLAHLRGHLIVQSLERDDLAEPGSRLLDLSFPPDYRNRTTRDEYLRRVEGRCRWAARTGSRYIYIGSTSSEPPVTSIYGATKRQAEQLALAWGHSVLRAGLVICSVTPGGRFGQLERIVKRLPVVPLPDISQFRLRVTDMHNLLSDVSAVVEQPNGPRERLVTGTSETSLAELVEMMLAPRQRAFKLGPRTSFAAARVASSLHWGPFDALSSLARTSATRDGG